MIGIIISGHGVFGDGLYSSLKLIAGEQENFQVVNFEEESNTDLLQISLREAFNEVETGSGTVIFTDIPGGTPYNQAVLLSVEKQKIRVVSGVNVPCLLTACFSRTDSLEEFVMKVIQAGKDSLSVFEKKDRKEKEQNEEGGGI